MNQNKLLISILSVLYILHEMPTVGIKFNSGIFAVVVVCLFVFLLKSIGFRKFAKILPIFIIPILDTLINYNGAFSFFQGISGVLQSLVLPMLAIYLYKFKNIKLATFLFSIYIGANLITCFTTYIGCQIYPGASRDLVTGLLETPMYETYMNANIGGFGFIYQMSMLSVIAICCVKNFQLMPKGYLILLVSIIFLIGICMAVIAAEYTTAIILLTFSLFLLIEERTVKFKRFSVLGIFTLIFFSTFKPIISETLTTISENIESYNISHRLKDLALSLEGKNTQKNSDMDAREECYRTSLNSFAENPLGGWSQSVSGKHSFILDSLAKYGLFGLFLLIFIFRKIYVHYIVPLKNTYVYGYGIFVYILSIILSVINPILFTNIIMFVIPVFILVLVKRPDIKSQYNLPT